ncbi:MAG: DUF1003 domain-containing protein [Patescibacteria group bacterium]|jgi:uncharacterized membrane protein
MAIEQKNTHTDLSPHIYGKRTLGQRMADNLASYAGSWGFIILFFVVILLWIILNAVLLATKPWDPYPFILLNLALSLLAAIQAPVILMSQNRAAQRDRKKAELDLAVDRKAEKKIEEIQSELQEIKKLLQK